MNSIIKIVCFGLIIFSSSCKKFLDEKPNKQLSTPDSADDLQALLDNQSVYYNTVASPQIAADDYYIPQSTWATSQTARKLAYIWDPQVDYDLDWTTQYALVLLANTVLTNVEKVTNTVKANELKGSALFLRAHSYFQISQIYAPQYDSTSAGTDLGIVLRYDPDFTTPSQRATVKQSYDQIISDLTQAIELLPNTTVVNTRPNKAAGYALLARVYLQIGNNQKAKEEAIQSLNSYNLLIDYNDISEIVPTSNNPIVNLGILNKEILFYQADQSSFKPGNVARVDSNLYKSYTDDDIRKLAFFALNTDNSYRFKASYVAPRQFTGIGTPEVYLIKAEANARMGNTQEALQDLNELLQKRYKTGLTPIFTSASIAETLDIILKERQKEMIYRGMRWADLKRLNKNPSTAVTLRRNLNGTIYSLPPNDLRYTFLIPQRVMQLSNLQQNPR